jgi:hypothetical protein
MAKVVALVTSRQVKPEIMYKDQVVALRKLRLRYAGFFGRP